ncbi:MAG TPA: TIGR02206 family membrane protein [Rhizomicrobium sp.]|jgi:hypothetical integral membrane protein (TIGR02206 family)
MAAPFAWFGASHVAAMTLTVVVPLGLATLVHLTRYKNAVRVIRLAFAAELIATWILWYWMIAARGWLSAQTLLPMDLCGWASIAAIATLLRPGQRSFELAYFWALTGTVQALATPELFYDFPDLRFIVFFAFHGGTIAAVLFLVFGAGMRPTVASIPRVLAASLVYLVLTLATNRVFHTNFGYLSAKPAKPSLLDVMGPWPVYIAEIAGVAILLVLILYSPFFVADALKKRGPGHIVAEDGGKKSLPFPAPR